MLNDKVSSKHAQVDKNNTTIFIVIGLAVAILSFTIVGSISLGRRLSYQNKVINARSNAEDQLNSNYTAIQELLTSYKSFDGAAESVIGTSDNNSKIVLDALPSKYDFPALAASLEKLIKITGGISSYSIGGTDQEAVAEQSSADPKPIEIPLTVSGQGSYENIQKLVINIQASIRPIKISRVSLSGEQSSMSFSLTMTTYYMPAKILDIKSEEIR